MDIETRGRWVVRLAVGLFLAGAGMFKLIGSLGPPLEPGLAGFSRFFETAGAPFPMLSAMAACAVEIVAGLGLAAGGSWSPAHRFTRLFGLAIVADMTVAVATVGVRTALGDPLVIDGEPLASESWRLPLELGVLATGAYFARWPRPHDLTTRK